MLSLDVAHCFFHILKFGVDYHQLVIIVLELFLCVVCVFCPKFIKIVKKRVYSCECF